MADRDKTSKKSMHGPKNVRDQHYKAYYPTNMQIRMSFFDFRITAGEIAYSSENPDEMLFIEQGSIILSPQHAKVVYRLLGDKIHEYENEFGEIPEQPREKIQV